MSADWHIFGFRCPWINFFTIINMKINGFEYSKSTAKGKKLMTQFEGKTIHFGQLPYGQFKDKTGLFKSLDHNDSTRRKNYLRRTANIRDKRGRLTRNDPSSSNYHARRILWGA